MLHAGDKRIALGLFALTWVTFAWFYGGTGWNQAAHFDFTRALVERRTLAIDDYASNTGDTSEGTDHHLYMNKPPGASVLAAVPYAIVYAVEHVLGMPSDRMVRTNEWIATATSCGLCGALIAPLIYLYGRRRARRSATTSLAVALAIVFGTIVFAYSTMLFAHVPAAIFLLLAVVLADERPFAAGIAAGMATTCFYVCAPAVAVIALVARQRWRVLAGSAPFAVALGVYHWLCFGSPFRTSMEASTYTERGRAFGVLALPKWEAFWGITFMEYRGLFYASPVLLFAFFGLGRMWREARRDLISTAAISAIFIITISSFNGWWGGWGFGSRYLLPIIPLLGLMMLYAIEPAQPRTRVLWVVAAAVSVFLNFVGTATDPLPSPGLPFPIVGRELPLFFTGRYNGEFLGHVSVALESGNLGEIFFSRGSLMTVLPIAPWMIAGSALLFRQARRAAPY
jgi:hypothetical protein